MKITLKGLGFLFLLPFLYIIIVLIVAQVTYYSPKEVEQISNNNEVSLITDSTFTLMSWNIGYAGLGAQSDFFYDGGKMTRSPKLLQQTYWSCIQEYLENEKQVDFFLLQEVDVKSKRSWYTNQKERLKQLRSYNNFALNYNVNYVPLKLTQPLGKVKSGLLSVSDYQPSKAYRYQFPGSYSFPNKLFFLRRCFLVQYYPLKNSANQFVLINAHLSAYDEDGKLKKLEMNYLKEFITEEFNKGNYVIVGADWNQKATSEQITSYLPDWTIAYDGVTPTNRSLETVYDAENTQVSTIDYFILSPNIVVDQVKTVDLQFACSDHQPVKLICTLNM